MSKITLMKKLERRYLKMSSKETVFIIDNISGELIECLDFQVALDIAQWRVKEHNKEFNYSHRGKHYSANCKYEIEDKTHIVIKKD